MFYLIIAEYLLLIPDRKVAAEEAAKAGEERLSAVAEEEWLAAYKQKAAAERQAQKLMDQGYGDLVVMEYNEYLAKGYDKLTRKVRSLMTGEEVEEDINTPNCCSVASETYWSM